MEVVAGEPNTEVKGGGGRGFSVSGRWMIRNHFVLDVEKHRVFSASSLYR